MKEDETRLSRNLCNLKIWVLSYFKICFHIVVNWFLFWLLCFMVKYYSYIGTRIEILITYLLILTSSELQNLCSSVFRSMGTRTTAVYTPHLKWANMVVNMCTCGIDQWCWDHNWSSKNACGILSMDWIELNFINWRFCTFFLLWWQRFLRFFL